MDSLNWLRTIVKSTFDSTGRAAFCLWGESPILGQLPSPDRRMTPPVQSLAALPPNGSCDAGIGAARSSSEHLLRRR